MTREELANSIWRACDIMRRDNNCGGIMEYLEHLSWLLFLRFLDAQEDAFEAEARIAGRRYERILAGDLRWSAWARRDWPGDELLRFVHGTLLEHLRNLSGSPERDIIRGLFAERNVVVCASPYNLKDVLQIIDQIDFLNTDDIHTVSFVYEDLLRRLGSENRMAGEFYTPRPVIRFMVDSVDPKIGETVYDPACGSCGFLAESFVRMRSQAQTRKAYETLQRETFYGQEKKALPALLGLMNMILHGVQTPQVVRRNTLEENIREVAVRFDVVLTNPPFGGTENRQIQSNFPVESNATELLFLQHVMKKLKARDGARCGLVVPEGTLFRGGAFAKVKKELLETFYFHALVSLPPGTFAPYSDVKAALLFFERPGPTRETFYYELPLPNGLKKFSKGSPIQDEHFEEARTLCGAWRAYRRGEGPLPEPAERSWFESVQALAARGYDLSAKNPSRPEGERVPRPAELTATLLERNRELHAILENLHELVVGESEP